MAVIQNRFDKLQSAIGEKIDAESGKLTKSIADLADKIDTRISKAFAEQFGLYFDQRMLRVYGVIGGVITTAFGFYKFVSQSTSPSVQGYLLLIIGVLLLIATILLTRSPRKAKE